MVLSGCSGGGKSSLLEHLAGCGFAITPEPGRRIVEEELRRGGGALPWIDLAAFARRAIDLAAQDRVGAQAQAGWIFFDRGLVDAAAALEHAIGQPATETLDRFPRYHRQVFLTPPWPEIYVGDSARRHGLDEAISEYERLIALYAELDYAPIVVPRLPIAERAAFVLDHLR